MRRNWPTGSARPAGCRARKCKAGASHGSEGRGAAAQQIDAKIAAFDDWRGQPLAQVRALIHEALPDVVETVKWGRVPVWERDGILTTGETYKAVVKLTFAKGALLDDPAGLFNSSLDGNVRRAIDIREGETVDGEALKALVRAAAALNAEKKRASRA